ncbi:MAG TPA: hypothetical protein VKB19_02715 [Pedobacter sp.]|nr:hypothetical protein [Pedobacter sp.]
MSKGFGLFIVFILLSTYLRAQDTDPVKDMIENYAEYLPDDYDLSELTERLGYYLKNPINLNHATPLQLKELAFLSMLQINNFFIHLKRNGLLLDILELQGIDGFDVQTIGRLMPFVTLKSEPALYVTGLEDLYAKGNSDLIVRYGQTIQTQKGFTDLPGSRYLGSPEKLLFRYKFVYSDLMSASLVAEKDAGEHLFSQKNGADHLSFNLSLYKTGRIKKLVLGDYSLQFGQGLTLWSGFSFGKGPDVTSVAAKDVGLRPYQSSNEVSFFRGVASTLSLSGNIDMTTFVSFRKLDASLKKDHEHGLTLQNIGTSGLHRTSTELKNQQDLEQLVYGTVFQYLSQNLGFGFTGYRSEYQHKFVTGTQLYNKYGFTGKQLINLGFHYNYTYKNVYFYGELAHSLNSGLAIVNGAMVSLSPELSAVLLYRSYDRDHHNFFSTGVGEATETSNEKGIYLGLNYHPFPKWTFSAYGDYFRFSWLKYRVDSASSGYELLGQAVYAPVKTFRAVLRYKRETKQQNPDAGNTDVYLVRVLKQSLRVDCSWQLSKALHLHQRIELAGYQKELVDERGYLFLQDADFKPARSRFSGNIRLAFFKTSSYNSRIYAYEDDVLYGASSGAYSDTGFRGYANVRIRLVRQLDVWGRYGIYIYKDKENLGSGLDEITGNIKSDIKIQMRYQF